MEVFSLLKYWRTNGGATTTTTDANVRTTTTTSNTTPSTTTTIRHVAEETDNSADDDGPFFDLEFAVPDDDVGENECDVSDSEEDENDSNEFDFTVDSSCSTGNRTDPNLSLSPSDDLFFNGRFVPLEPSELGFNSTESSSKVQFPGSLLKPATKLRVLMLGFKKPKSTSVSEKVVGGSKQQSKSSLTVKFKVEEVPIVSLFTRDNSSRNSGNKIKQVQSPQSTTEEVASDEKKFNKDVLQKYLKMVKPLYFKVSKRYGEKLGFSGQLNLSPISSPIKKTEGEIKESEVNVNSTTCNVKSLKEGNLTAGLRNVRKHLGKSRSASSAVAAVAAVPPSMATQSRRHDDSLLQQQDGIQSAILHCKRSFTASRDSDSDSSALSRSSSDPSHEKSKSANTSRTSLDEAR
ncbi:membrane-associated kinase regulator [Thalictrum thalictroides]|uniref:Membrane-associated kinase regulator n=1 Tax=Thalictrum thalictroides TaxID=46969 RepID=A0A7J6V686_THATH|nr:membrane-associated kinase regulator [Thalictrum thalictroides]